MSMRALLQQLTLDLFGGAPPPPPPSSPAPAAASPPPEPAAPADDEASTTDAAPATPVLPPIALPDAVDRASFVHPRATREIVLGEARVAYEFTRGRRRTIGFVVDAEGLSVRAPRWVALRDVDAAVAEKSGWILRKLAEAQQRQAQLEAARVVWKDGAAFPFLGETVVVQLDPRHGFAGGAVLDPGDGAQPPVLRLALPHGASAAQIRDAAQAWLMRQARRIFIERLDHFAPRLGVRWHKLSLSNAATRWGSASADGAIRLHWRLVHFRMAVIDYVVAHELSHLRVMDHSPRFWDTVESVVPDYGALREELKAQPVPK